MHMCLCYGALKNNFLDISSLSLYWGKVALVISASLPVPGLLVMFLPLTLIPLEGWDYICSSLPNFLWAPDLELSGQACAARVFAHRTIVLAFPCIFLTLLSKVSGCSSESFQCLLFCGIGLHVCFCARAMLFALPWFCGPA